MKLFTRFVCPSCYEGIVRTEPASDQPTMCDPTGMVDLKSQIKMLLQAGDALDAYRRSHFPVQFDFPNGEVDDDLQESAPWPSDKCDELQSDVATDVLQHLAKIRLARKVQVQQAHGSAAETKGGATATSAGGTGAGITSAPPASEGQKGRGAAV